MNQIVMTYGFSREDFVCLQEEMPAGYILRQADDARELILYDGICSMIAAGNIDEESHRLLASFYSDNADNPDGQVIWIGAQNKLTELSGVYMHYNRLPELLPELHKVLHSAQKYYVNQKKFHSPYGFLPKHGIEEILEEELHKARRNKYEKVQDLQISRRVVHEWTALAEVDGIPELAAVYELASWLKRNKHPYRFGGTAASGFVPYLLGIHDVNPLPTHLYCSKCKTAIGLKDGFDIPSEVCLECGGLMQGDGHNLVWQKYASYGHVPSYVFYLPWELQPCILDWLDNHWLRKFMGDRWEAAQQYEDHLVRGNMHFYFGVQNDGITEIPRFCCEDVFHYLKAHGFPDKDAFCGMESVRKGKGLPVVTEDMRTAEDYWKAEYFNQVEWLPSKAMLLQKLFFELESQRNTDLLVSETNI